MTERQLDPFPYTPKPVLVGDLGGTNIRLALADGGVLRAGSIRRYRCADFPDLAAVLRLYLGQTVTGGLEGVCIAAAGPVRHGTAQLTNLGWRVDQTALPALTGAPRAVVLNDLQAQGLALAHLHPHQLRCLRPGAEGHADETRLAVGLGTGFNAAPVHPGPAGPLVPASESGHIHLPRHGDEEEALARDLAAEHGIATIEQVLSGRGLVALHRWRTGTEAGSDEIVQALTAGTPQAIETGRMFARLLGRTLASLALVHLPHGGIYLTGGLARALGPHLVALGLIEGFSQMGRFADMMDGFGLHVVEDDFAALTGCAVRLLGRR